MTEELSPCPFCGGEAYIVPGVYRDGSYIENCAHVKCTKCGANGDTFSECLPFDVVERMAADAWNRRAERTCRMELLWTDGEDGECYECSECGDIAFTHCDAPEYCPNCGAKVVSE